MASFKKRLKRVGARVQDAAKTVGRAGANVIQYTAPIVGTVFLGPGLGTLAGGAVSAAASQVGPTKNKSKALKRTLAYSAAVGAAGGLVNVIGGGSITAPLTGLFGSKTANVGGGTDQTAGQTLPGGTTKGEWNPFTGGFTAAASQPATNIEQTPGGTQGGLLDKIAGTLLGAPGPTGQNTGLPTTSGGDRAGGGSNVAANGGSDSMGTDLLSNPLAWAAGLAVIFLFTK